MTESLGLQHFGCLQHCRTYYHKALKVTELPSGRALAKVAMEDYLGKVFKTERDIKELREQRERVGGTLDPEEILKLRRENSAPVLGAFKRWVDDLLPGVPPQSALARRSPTPPSSGRNWYGISSTRTYLLTTITSRTSFAPSAKDGAFGSSRTIRSVLAPAPISTPSLPPLAPTASSPART